MGSAAIALSLALSVAPSLHAQAPQLTIAPERPAPGAIVRISLAGVDSGAGAVTSIEGTLGREPLHFVRAAGGAWHAIGGVSPDAADSVIARVVVAHVSGVRDTLHASVIVPPVPPPTPAARSKLAVSQRFTRPLSTATQRRIARENAKAHGLGREAHEMPPLWSGAFIRPRDAVVTSPFGSGRVFNGSLTSRHLGVDFRGGPGEPIRAANRGIVALVDTFFLAGRVVYIDHGGGLVTGYFHMSKPLVSAGDTVARGQVIGLVGATGRVTGPHLHWIARYGAVTVNPLDLVALDPAWYPAATSSADRATRPDDERERASRQGTDRKAARHGPAEDR